MAALSSTESSSSGGCHEGGAAGHIIAILTSKETFVKSQHSATPAQLAQFLRTMRDECLPLVRHTACPREVKRQLTKGFAYVGWDVKTNRCLRSSPPTLEQLKYMLGKCRANCEEHLAGLSDKAEPTDEELADSSLSLACTRLWELDVNRLVPGVDYEIDLQQGKKPYETGDRADKPLFKWVDQDVLVRPTWASFIALLDNYEASEGKAERVTKVELREENEFLDRNMRMPCMRYAHNFLVKHGKASASVAEFKKEVHDLWFGLYRRKCPNDSSGFEHVFVGEEDPKDGKIVGLHNWIQMYIQEGGMLPPGVGGQQEARRRSPPALDYLGYIRPRMRGSGEPEAKDQLLTVQFSWFGEVKDQSSSFIGVSPCFELALYTLVYLAGQEGKNLVQVGPHAVEVTCWPSAGGSHGRYIGTAFPAAAQGLTPHQGALKIQAVHRGNATRRSGQRGQGGGGPAAVQRARREHHASSKIQGVARGRQERGGRSGGSKK